MENRPFWNKFETFDKEIKIVNVDVFVTGQFLTISPRYVKIKFVKRIERSVASDLVLHCLLLPHKKDARFICVNANIISDSIANCTDFLK